jgi:hypothetical protein
MLKNKVFKVIAAVLTTVLGLGLFIYRIRKNILQQKKV